MGAMTWKHQLEDLIQTGNYRTQSGLVHALADKGYTVHQGSVSRELRALGVTKVKGVYVIPDASLGAPIHSATVTAGGGLVVLKTAPAFANVLAQAVDSAGLLGVLGTIAGDDTVFVATAGQSGLDALSTLLEIPMELA